MRWAIIILLIITHYAVSGQRMEFASKESRKRFKIEYDSIIQVAVNTPLSNASEGIWKKAIWGIQLMNVKELPLATLRKNILNLPIVNDNLQRNFMEMIYGQFPTQFSFEIRKIIYKLSSTRAQAMAYEYLKRNKIMVDQAPFKKRMKEDFRLDETDRMRLKIMSEYLPTKKTNLANTLSAILDPDYLPNKTIVISIQRPNRDYPGLVIIKGKNGKVYRTNGEVFTIPQIARSMSNLPYYITNGNTPAGLFLMDSLDVSENKYIGPTRNVQIRLPYNEASVSDMNFGKYSAEWSEQEYKKLLPASLRSDAYLMQTYFAGKCNRTEIISHGTTVDPEYYKGTPYYPQTPTLGCLCMVELYDDYGNLTRSDQNILADAILQAGGANGYYFVIETSDIKGAVTKKEVLAAIR